MNLLSVCFDHSLELTTRTGRPLPVPSLVAFPGCVLNSDLLNVPCKVEVLLWKVTFPGLWFASMPHFHNALMYRGLMRRGPCFDSARLKHLLLEMPSTIEKAASILSTRALLKFISFWGQSLWGISNYITSRSTYYSTFFRRLLQF